MRAPDIHDPAKDHGIHLVRDQYFPLHGFVFGAHYGHTRSDGRVQALLSASLISAFEHDLTRVFFQASALQQGSQRYTGPCGIADGAEFPLRSCSLWDQKDPTIPCALQSGDPRLGRYLSQLLVAQRKRIPDRTIDAQLYEASSNVGVGK